MINDDFAVDANRLSIIRIIERTIYPIDTPWVRKIERQ